MHTQSLRVAFFPDVYLEVDGVANTSRRFEAFWRSQELPLLVVHAGPRTESVTAETVTRVQLERGSIGFDLDCTHRYDFLFLRHYRRVERILRDFRPDIVQITGPSDVGILGALLAHNLKVPLAATWQTNLHLYARMRAGAALSFLPKNVSAKVLPSVERWTLAAALRFYKIPRLLFSPNQEVVNLLNQKTGKPCLLMSHAVDGAVFSPAFRDRRSGPFRIGYVGRLTPEKNVRWLARLEQALSAQGHTNFQILVVGEGSEENWLRQNMHKAEFTGLLSGEPLSRAFANMDLFVFPSMTDTFGLVILEALASGVPAVVTSQGGPKYSVQHAHTGYVANNFDDFAAYAAALLAEPDRLIPMRLAARQYALSTSWEQIFEGMYAAYRRYLLPEPTSEFTVPNGRPAETPPVSR